jgi:hypothetical protein
MMPSRQKIQWTSLADVRPEIGEVVMIASDQADFVAIGYSEWTDRIGAPPRWISMHPNGFGQCKPTHWAPVVMGPAMTKGESDGGKV